MENTVTIDNKYYQIYREGDEDQAYNIRYENEPPWTQGSPGMVSDPSYTWHLGGLKSIQGIPGSSEYGINTDARWPFRLLPGPKINNLVLKDTEAPPSFFFGGLGYIWVLANTKCYRVDIDKDEVILSKDDFATVLVSGIEWESKIYVTLANGTVWQMSEIGTPDTWSLGVGNINALHLAKGFNRLFKTYNNSDTTVTLKNLRLGLDPTDENNWADEVFALGESKDLIAYERTVLASTGSAGLQAIGELGFGIPIARRLRPTSRMAFIEPYIYIPHQDGLSRFVPGIVEAVGPENELLNNSPVAGEITGITSSEAIWLYLSVYDSIKNVTHVLAGRERKGSEPGFGPLLWDTLFHVSGKINHLELSHNSDDDTDYLLFNSGNDLSYVILPHNGGAPVVNNQHYRFSLDGERHTFSYNFNDRGEKDFPKVSVKGKGLDDNTYWTLGYRIDGSNDYLTLDKNGREMTLKSDSLTHFQLPTSAKGVDIQYRFEYTGIEDNTPGSLTYFEPFAVPRPRKIALITCYLELAGEQLLESPVRDIRVPSQQYFDLQELKDKALAVKISAPFINEFETTDAYIRSLSLVSVRQKDDTLTWIVEALLQIRES